MRKRVLSRSRVKRPQKPASDLFLRADKQWERGELRSAFLLFMSSAKAGDKSAQLNVGYFYDRGIGVKRNSTAALYWYKRAYRHGDASAPHNIGTIWRDAENPKRALLWFQRAVSLGNDGSHLEIAKHYLRNEHDPSKAMDHLEKICVSPRVAEADAEEAKRLLQRLKRGLNSTTA